MTSPIERLLQKSKELREASTDDQAVIESMRFDCNTSQAKDEIIGELLEALDRLDDELPLSTQKSYVNGVISKINKLAAGALE